MDTPADESAHEDLRRTLHIVSDWIKVADTKAGATLTVDGAVLAVTAAQVSRPRRSRDLGFIHDHRIGFGERPIGHLDRTTESTASGN